MGDYISSLMDWGSGSSVLGNLSGEVDAGYYDLPVSDMSEAGMYDIPVGSSLADMAASGFPAGTDIDYGASVPSSAGWKDYLPSGKTSLGLGGLGLTAYGLLSQRNAASQASGDATSNALANYNSQMSNWANQLALQRQYYEADRYPNADKMASSKASTMANINQSLMTAKNKLMEDTASRGLQGSSVASGLTGLAKSGLQTKANALTQLEEYANTPLTSGSFSVPTMPSLQLPTSGTAANSYSTASALTNLGSGLLGMYARNLMGQDDSTALYNQLLRNLIGG
jgi:hypothetical protein